MTFWNGNDPAINDYPNEKPAQVSATQQVLYHVCTMAHSKVVLGKRTDGIYRVCCNFCNMTTAYQESK